MWKIRWILCFHLTACAFGLQIHDGCVSTEGRVVSVRGTEVQLTAWLPPDTPDTTMLLTLEARQEKEYFKRKVSISRSVVVVEETWGGGDTTTFYNLTKGALGDGWGHFLFTMGSRLRVVAGAEAGAGAGEGEVLVDAPDGSTADAITVRGSNVTVNCPHPVVVWDVIHDNSVTIPLASTATTHYLTLFSRASYRPQVTLDHHDLLLSWDEVSEAVSTLRPSFHEPKPLPPFLLHHLAVTCRPRQNFFKCDLTTVGGKLAGSVLVPHNPSSLTFAASHYDDYMVVLGGVARGGGAWEECWPEEVEEATNECLPWQISTGVFGALLVAMAVAVAVLIKPCRGRGGAGGGYVSPPTKC